MVSRQFQERGCGVTLGDQYWLLFVHARNADNQAACLKHVERGAEGPHVGTVKLEAMEVSSCS